MYNASSYGTVRIRGPVVAPGRLLMYSINERIFDAAVGVRYYNVDSSPLLRGSVIEGSTVVQTMCSQLIVSSSYWVSVFVGSSSLCRTT